MPVTRLEPAACSVTPPLNTLCAILATIASALRLSPVPPVFDWMTNWSPAAGVPVICTRVPLMSMFAPGV